MISLILAFLPPLRPVQASSGNSLFGYTYIYPSYSWDEINATGTVILNGSDNGSAEVDLPFAFMYFENSYAANTHIRVSANGFIAFDPLLAGYSINKSIPLDELPNNIIAPFWDDLAVGAPYNSGKVYSATLGSPSRKIIEWDQVTRRGSTDTLSFQVVFLQDETLGVNAIEFRYKSLNGVIDRATIGIEDADGVDGIQVPNATIHNLTAVRFLYPGQTSRFKAYPIFQSALMRGRTALLPATVRNTSSPTLLIPDRYNVTTSRLSGATNWTVALLNGSGQPLTDTNADGIPDTSLIASGISQTVQVRFTAPLSATIGDFLQLAVTFTSVKDNTKWVTITRQATVSAPFVQSFSDTTAGFKLQAVNPTQNFTRTVNSLSDAIPNSLAMAPTSNFHYISAWSYGSGNHFNIRYTLTNLTSSNLPVIRQLVDNPDFTLDHSISIAVAPNGNIGLAYIRTKNDPLGSDAQNLNVYFARLDPSGTLLGTLVNITNNDLWGTTNDAEKPFYSGVVASATQDNRFLISWTMMKIAQDRTIQQDIFTAVYNAVNGAQLSAPQKLTSSTATIGYIAPSQSQINSTNTFLSYISSEPSNPTTPIKLLGVTLDNLGQPGTIHQLAVINGSQIDTIQLWGGYMLAAWIDNTTLKPNYGVWTTAGVQIKAPTPLEPPDGRSMRQIAVTRDQYGHGILTWGDQQGSRIYYALVDASGTLITPPMIQRSSDASNIDLGSSVFSSAFLADPINWLMTMPYIKR